MSKLLFILLFAIFINISLKGQIDESIKQLVRSYPSSISSCEKLAERINTDFSSTKDRAGAIYVWITYNISYDVEAANSNKKSKGFTYRTQEEKLQKEEKYNDKIISKAFRKRKAICDGYSRIFKKLCDLSNIECVIISGTSKTTKTDIGKLPKISDHAWNAIKVDDKWELIDATWGAGNVNSKTKEFKREYREEYFCTKPEYFFLKHFPKDPKWLLLKKSKKDFANLPLYYSSFFISEIEFISPNKGIIEKAKKSIVHFKIKVNGKTPHLTYAFNNDKHSKAVDVTSNNGEITFSIPIDNRRRGYLTIYHRNRAIVMYKLNLK